MSKKIYSLQQILKMDGHLMQLAAYETSRGMVQQPKDMEEVNQMQQDILKQFNYFKRMIQTCECTFEELEQMVLKRHGAVPNADHNLTFSESLTKMAREPKVEEPKFDMDDIFNSFMNDLTNSLPKGTYLIASDALGSAYTIPKNNPEEPEKNVNMIEGVEEKDKSKRKNAKRKRPKNKEGE